LYAITVNSEGVTSALSNPTTQKIDMKKGLKNLTIPKEYQPPADFPLFLRHLDGHLFPDKILIL